MPIGFPRKSGAIGLSTKGGLGSSKTSSTMSSTKLNPAGIIGLSSDKTPKKKNQTTQKR